MHARREYVRIILIFLLYAEVSLAERIGCKDENGENVDWFINYKLPMIEEDDEDDLKDGVAYAYILAPGSEKWTLSTQNVLSESGSMMGNTLSTYYKSEKEFTYIFYNDDPPKKKAKSTGGHAKGVLVFDDETGFWLMHSIPNFPDHKQYDYPETAHKYGQIALCVTFKTSVLNKIIDQLLFINPNIYAKALSAEVEEQLDEDAISIFSRKPSWITKEPFLRKCKLRSLGGVTFSGFAKDNQLEKDLYSDIIAPYLKTSLIAETWRNGAGGLLEKQCNTLRTVVDVKSISMKLSKGKEEKNVGFDSTQDHSKWAISDEEDQNYVCIADLNRMASQGKRGGGALCFESPSVITAFDSIIEKNEACNKRMG